MNQNDLSLKMMLESVRIVIHDTGECLKKLNSFLISPDISEHNFRLIEEQILKEQRRREDAFSLEKKIVSVFNANTLEKKELCKKTIEQAMKN